MALCPRVLAARGHSPAVCAGASRPRPRPQGRRGNPNADLEYPHLRRPVGRRSRMELSLDSLTGLPNLIALVDDVRELPAGRGALVLTDLSDLSTINESHGRPVGDQVIQALGMALGQQIGRASCRERV